MSMVRLIYSSEADLDIRLADIKSILASARKNNARSDVCGMLYYDSNYFLQTLEGDEENVHHIFDKIAEDFRHDDIKVLAKEPIQSRLFSKWQMGYAGDTTAVQHVLQRFGFEDENFCQLNGESALQLLVELSEVQGGE